MTGTDRLLRLATAARLLGIHRSTVYGLIARGELEAHTVDGRLLVDRVAVKRLTNTRARRRARRAQRATA